MTQITVPNVPMEVTYAISSPTTGPFVVPFAFFDEEDVFVTVIDAAGGETALVHINDFTFSVLTVPVGQEGSGFEGGELDLNAAAGGTGFTLRIYRSTTIDRTANFPLTGPFSIPVLNDEQNRNTMMLQEMDTNKVSRKGGVLLDDLDMNNFRILNLPTALLSHEPLTLGQFTASTQNPADKAANEVITGQWTFPNNTILLDPAGRERRIAFRRNTGRYISNSTALSQDDDDSFIEYSGAGGDMLTLGDPLEVGTTVTVLNVGSGALTIAENVGNQLKWLNGSAVLIGNRTLSVGGVMTLKYESESWVGGSSGTSLVKCWGLGVS